VLERIMEQAAAQGDKKAYEHAARLRAISMSGRKDAALAVLARESVVALARWGGLATEY
jgi:hypothetical protein